MKRISLLAVAGLLFLLFSAPVASAFGVKDVLKMNRDEIPDSLIVMKIENSGKTFHLSADDMRALHDAGVSNEVISAMLRTEGRDRRDYGNGDYYNYPYSYPYYSYPYSRLYLGFGYRHYYSPYYGGYRTPRYRPYYSNPYGGNYGNQRYRGSYGNQQPSTGGTGSQYRSRQPTTPGTGTQSRHR
jgi:hypothetical protein